MKRTLLSALFVIICFEIMAQDLTPQKQLRLTDKELGLKYLKRSRQFKVAGWSLLAGGIILSTIGVNQATSDLFSNNHAGETLSLAGSIITIASIPCFITGAKNKGRAEILLRNENILVSDKYKYSSNFLAVGLAFKL